MDILLWSIEFSVDPDSESRLLLGSIGILSLNIEAFLLLKASLGSKLLDLFGGEEVTQSTVTSNI